ncbi:MAG: proton-conducting transporter membrane subunit [Planctomycetota bacterium]
MTTDLPISVLLLAGALAALLLPVRAVLVAGLVAALALAQSLFGLVAGPDHVHLMGEAFALGGPAVCQQLVAALLLAAALALRDDARRSTGTALLVFGAGLAGALGGQDLLAWFTWMSLAAVGGVVLVLGRGDRASYDAALRGFVPLVVGGFLVIAGAVLRYVHLHTFALLPAGPDGALPGFFESLGRAPEGLALRQDVAAPVLLIGLLVLAAAPLLHGWWIEWTTAARPAVGAVLLGLPLAAAVLAAQAFAQSAGDVLLVVGGLGAFGALAFAVLCDDLRRLLAYGAIACVGLALFVAGRAGDQAPAAAFAVLGAQALALVALGFVADVLERRVGTTHLSRLGGLLRERPLLFACALGGAFALAGAIPFVAPSAVAAEAALRSPAAWAWVPLAALAGLFAIVGLKLVVGAFLGPDKGWRPVAAGRALDALAPLLALLASAAVAVAGDLPAPGWAAVGGGEVLLVQLVLLGGLAAFLLARGAVVPADPLPPPLDVHVGQALAADAIARFVRGPLMAFFDHLHRFAHETVPGTLWKAARNPPGAMMLVWRRLRLAAASLLGARTAVADAQAALARDEARYEARSAATPWPIGNIVLYVALVFALYLALELL